MQEKTVSECSLIENTVQTDIANQSNNINVSVGSLSLSLPYMMGYVQPIKEPQGFVFGVKKRESTSIAGNGKDIILTRRLVTTDIREVKLTLTNEAQQDIDQLFSKEFQKNLDKFRKSGGEVWEGPNKEIAEFLLMYGIKQGVKIINQDFITWLDKVTTKKGTVDIASYSDMPLLFGAIGELREALYKSTKLSGKIWLLVSPKIATYISSTLGITAGNGANIFEKGRRKPTLVENGYVLTMGDVEVYTHDFLNDVTGGTTSDTESTGKMYVGFTGGANVSSIFYTPYKEYIVQGGEDYQTGQSSVFFKIRDAWTTNPLDTFDKSQSGVEMGVNTPDITETNTSQFIMSCDVTFNEKIIN